LWELPPPVGKDAGWTCSRLMLTFNNLIR
jgi:hypothetical protein